MKMRQNLQLRRKNIFFSLSLSSLQHKLSFKIWACRWIHVHSKKFMAIFTFVFSDFGLGKTLYPTRQTCHGISIVNSNYKLGISIVNSNYKLGISIANSNYQHGISIVNSNYQLGISIANSNYQLGISIVYSNYQLCNSVFHRWKKISMVYNHCNDVTKFGWVAIFFVQKRL